jgi:hypothetical protein
MAPTVPIQKQGYPTLNPIPVPSFFPTERPTFTQGTVCITVSILTIVAQDDWLRADSVLAMKQAIASSMDVPVSAIEVNYADQMCESAPTSSPTPNPTRIRKTLALESKSVPFSAPYTSNLSFSPSFDTKMAMVHLAADQQNALSKQLQFSVVLQLTGLI